MLRGGIPLNAPFGQPKGTYKPEEIVLKIQEKKLTPQARRLELEKAFFDAANNLHEKTVGLLEVKRDKLYLQVAETWEQYCNEVLGQSVTALRRQFKALELSEELSSRSQIDPNVPTPTLSEKDLRKMARLPDQDVEELLSEKPHDISDKLAKKKGRRKDIVKPAPIEPVEIQMEPVPKLQDDRADRLLARLRVALDQEGFLQALETLIQNWGL